MEKKELVGIEKIIIKLLEIFLKDDIDERILDQSSLSELAMSITGNIPSVKDPPISNELRFLLLKALIKINELKTNGDDRRTRDIRNGFTEILARARGESEEDIEELIEEGNKRYEKEWEYRDIVEGDIFEPLTLDSGEDCVYIKMDPKILYEYEKYLLDRIKYFYINDYLQELVETSFFNTKYKEFKPKYIDVMFCLEMRDALLRIILDDTVDTNLRQHAMEVSINLLKETDILNFNWFSYALLKNIRKISSNVTEKEELRKIAEEKIEVVDCSSIN